MEFDWKTWFLEVWEDNRSLTNRVGHALVAEGAIDKEMVQGMRPFRAMLLEIFGLEQWNVRGLAHDMWDFQSPPEALYTGPIEDVFAFGDNVRDQTRKLWPSIPPSAFTMMRPAPASFIPAGAATGWLTYALENEIHHRGQGYVYLRLLGKEPPAFYDRTRD